MWGSIIWFGLGLALLYFIWKIGLGMLRGMTSTLPPPPPAGEMRPKHCLEDMDLIAPID
jgi:hypothetical protein